MKTQKVVKLLQQGYPYFKEESGLPAWVVPEHSFRRMTDELGDESVLELSQPLRLTEGMAEIVDRCPDPEMVPADAWQTAVKLWPPHTQVKPLVDVCLDAASRILKQFQEEGLKVDPVAVCRGMAVLGCAPFVAQGKRIMKELAAILEGSVTDPAGLVQRYAQAVTSGDTDTVKRVDDCIAKRRQWAEWARVFLQQMKDFPYTPKVIGVTPPLSAEIVGVLAQMIREEDNDGPGRDYPEDAAGQNDAS